jgi:hypothetical protein
MNVKDYRAQIESQLSSTAAPAAASADQAASDPGPGWADAIRRLADPKADLEARKAALHELQAATFLGEQFAPYRADYLAALRSAMMDRAADHDLRHFALDVLVNFKDEFARQKLVEGLRGIGEALVAPAAALGLLARDDHDAASGIAREVLTRATDAFTRAQAVRLLGSDANAAHDLLDILKNKDEAREVRQASAVALKGLNENEFTRGALEILNDASDFDDIRETVRGALERKGIALPFRR